MKLSRCFTCPHCAVVGSPQHRLAPVAPENGLSAVVAQSAADLQLVEGADGGEVDAEAPGADEGVLRRATPMGHDEAVKAQAAGNVRVSALAYIPSSVIDPVANLVFLTDGVGLVPVIPQVGVGTHLICQVERRV